MTDDVRQRTNLQTYTLEYITTGAFDGVTVAPQISLDPSSPNYVEPDPVDQVYRVRLEDGQNIGLIDLSLFGGDAGGVGDRYVRWVLAGNTDVATFVDGVLGVYDTTQRDNYDPAAAPLLLELARSINGVEGFYDRSCIMVPQGGYLGISGLPPAASGKNVIRFHVQAPRTPWEAALVEESCCCDDGGPNIATTCPEILDISPSLFPPLGPADEQLLTIFGTGFRDGLAIQAERKPPDAPATANLTEFTVIDENTATVIVEFPTPPGTYTLTIFDPADPENCSGSGDFFTGSLQVCPSVTDVNPQSFVLNSNTNQFQAIGSLMTDICSWRIEQGGPEVFIIAFQESVDFENQELTTFTAGEFGFLGGAPGPARLVITPCDEDCPPFLFPVTIELA